VWWEELLEEEEKLGEVMMQEVERKLVVVVWQEVERLPAVVLKEENLEVVLENLEEELQMVVIRMLHWVKGLTFLIHNLEVRARRWHRIHQLQPSFMDQAMVCTLKQRAMVDIFKLCVVQPSWPNRPLMNKGELHGVANLSPSTTAPWCHGGHLENRKSFVRMSSVLVLAVDNSKTNLFE
jgi:hypothetical protein